MWRANSLEKTLMLGKIESNRRRGWQRMRWLDSISDPMHMNLNNIWEIMKEEETGAVLQYMRSESQTWQQLNNNKCARTHRYLHIHKHTHIYTQIYIPPYACTHGYPHIHLCIHTYTNIHTTICTYTQILVHTHTYTDIYMNMSSLKWNSFRLHLPVYFEASIWCPQARPPPGTDPSLTYLRQSKSRYRDVGPQPRQSCCFRCQRVSAAFIFKGKTEKPLGYLLRATLLNTSLKP